MAANFLPCETVRDIILFFPSLTQEILLSQMDEMHKI